MFENTTQKMLYRYVIIEKCVFKEGIGLQAISCHSETVIEYDNAGNGECNINNFKMYSI